MSLTGDARRESGDYNECRCPDWQIDEAEHHDTHGIPPPARDSEKEACSEQTDEGPGYKPGDRV